MMSPCQLKTLLQHNFSSNYSTKPKIGLRVLPEICSLSAKIDQTSFLDQIGHDKWGTSGTFIFALACVVSKLQALREILERPV